jgi:hypothetical protein
MQTVEDGPDLSVPEQVAFVDKVTDLAAGRLDDERIATLVQQLVGVMVQRADRAPTGQEVARRHGRIQNLIKRL